MLAERSIRELFHVSIFLDQKHVFAVRIQNIAVCIYIKGDDSVHHRLDVAVRGSPQKFPAIGRNAGKFFSAFAVLFQIFFCFIKIRKADII